MKIGSMLGGLLPLLLLVSCGGSEPQQSATKSSSTAKKPASNEGPQSAPSSSDTGATQAPKKPKKRTRRVRINYRVVQAVLGAETRAPAAPVASTPELVALGRALYHSEHLSAKGNVSCASCHDLSLFGADNKKLSTGSNGELESRNTPSTYNAHRQFRQYWDGRAESVEEQAIISVLSPTQHGLADEAALVAKIKEKSELVDGFRKAFPDEEDAINSKNFGVAVGAFERTLHTRSKWDDYIEGNQKALSEEEKLGLKTFRDVGCVQCHLGRALGGQMYQKLGLLKPYEGKDTGRMQVTGSLTDKYLFKVPMLLNVEKTAPYYHDGSIATLEEAVSSMASNQLNKELKDEQVASIVTFLKALTGSRPAK